MSLKSVGIFSILYIFWFYLSQKYVDFGHKLGVWRIKLEKYDNLIRKVGKISDPN